MRKLVLFLLFVFPVTVSAQYTPAGPCVLAGETANFCLAPAQNGYWMTGNLSFQGRSDMVQAPGGYFGTVELGDPRDGAGIAISGRVGMYFRGDLVVGIASFDRVRIPLSEDPSLRTEGEGETDSNGVGVVVFSSKFQRITNTEPTERGGYRVHLTAIGPEGVYWDRESSTPTQFVVKSFSGKKAQFVYQVSAVPVNAEIRSPNHLRPGLGDTESFLRMERHDPERVRGVVQFQRE